MFFKLISGCLYNEESSVPIANHSYTIISFINCYLWNKHMQALQYPNAWVNRKVYNWMMELKRKWSVAYQLFLEPFLQYIFIKILKCRIRVYKQQWCFLVFNTFWFAVMQILFMSNHYHMIRISHAAVWSRIHS